MNFSHKVCENFPLVSDGVYVIDVGGKESVLSGRGLGMMPETLALLVRITLGAVFLAAGVAKLLDRAEFEKIRLTPVAAVCFIRSHDNVLGEGCIA